MASIAIDIFSKDQVRAQQRTDIFAALRDQTAPVPVPAAL
jgi:hypothetical protein